MDNSSKKTFMTHDQNGNQVEAEIITLISIENREYLIYSIPVNFDESNVCASRVIRDENGNQKLLEIDNESDKSKITEFINTLTN